jgi:hypothetical protein
VEERRLIEAGRTANDLAPVEPGAWRVVIRNRQVQLLTAGYFESGIQAAGRWMVRVDSVDGRRRGSGIRRLAVRSSVEAARGAAQLQVSGSGRRGGGSRPVAGGRVGAGRRASAACGLLNTGGNLSGGVVALAVPLVVDRFGWPAALATGSACALVAAGLWLVTSADVMMEDPVEAAPHAAVPA